MSGDTNQPLRQSQTCGNFVFDIFHTLYTVGLSLIKSCFQNVLSLFWFLPGRCKDITDDVVLITGGGKGLGRLIAVQFAKQRPKVIILWGRHSDTLAATASVIHKMSVACDFMVCDVSSREQVQQAAQTTLQKHGAVTILVNNAGVVYGNTILDSDPQEMERTIQVNTVAHFWTVKAFLPAMLSSNHGHLVFINSMLGLMPLEGAADYCCSKHAVTGFTESLALEIAMEGCSNVHVTSIHPFLVDNEMFAGCQTRFPWLFPALDPDYVSWKVVDAVLTNAHVVLIPRVMYLLHMVASFLPRDAVIAVHRFTGVDKAMDNFHGRKAKLS